MTPVEIAGVIERAATLLTERYVFAEVGERLADLLRRQLAEGRYREATDPAALGTLVTEDLQSVNGDGHLRLKHHPQALPESVEDPTEAELTRTAEELIGGIARVQRLDGNVGLVEIAPYLLPPALAGTAMVAAMQLVARTEALILDLRQTVGGDPEMVALVCGYLFDEPVHQTTIHERDGAGRQFWSPAFVPGPRFGGRRPLYVLTSARTFSGGESLSYDLQQLGRATVVGERTGGGAHPRIGCRVHAHLELAVPVARPVSPVTGTNWEGAGVTPDIEVPAAEALDVAHRAALRRSDPDRPSPVPAGRSAEPVRVPA